MQEIKTGIIPEKQSFATLDGIAKKLDLKAICAYVATGFFLDHDTFWQNKKVLRPGTTNKIDEGGNLVSSSPYFSWKYDPDESLSFDNAVDQFQDLFEGIISEQVEEKRVILPLSGGLDSRSQAVALHALGKNVSSYSYAFEDGYPEYKIGRQIAKQCNFEFKAFEISKGYLWNCIEKIPEINECYSEFTNPRQMAVIDKFKELGDVFSLGHWGDVLFDDMDVPEDLDFDSQIRVIKKKIVKPSGFDLARKLWQYFQLEGDFDSYFDERLRSLHNRIDIPNSANARIRAFKSVYWAPRWTTVNLNFFSEVRPITLPYYDNRMCEFICKIPEKYLAKRAIQIEYIKRRNPEVAAILWHQQKPFNLNNYHYNKIPYNLPYRVYSKLYRMGKALIQKPFIQRNWELQFLGKSNQENLKQYLSISDFVPHSIVDEVLNDFNTKDPVYHSHALSMILTLSLWDKFYND